ncbi:hypothetical protein TgHK011_007579 [Trichoderma gracile]|nr:hypothetical protein TgHK011_007579 [Trichoderma gracile]
MSGPRSGSCDEGAQQRGMRAGSGSLGWNGWDDAGPEQSDDGDLGADAGGPFVCPVFKACAPFRLAAMRSGCWPGQRDRLVDEREARDEVTREDEAQGALEREASEQQRAPVGARAAAQRSQTRWSPLEPASISAPL